MRTNLELLLAAIEKANTVAVGVWSRESGSSVAAAYSDGLLADHSTCLNVIAILLDQARQAQQD